jgi:phage major head subunit gpT-like protein
MADFNKTASAKSAIRASGSDIHTSENFKLALARGLDMVWKRDFETPKQGMNLLFEDSIKQETASYQTFRTLGGVTPQNRDADEMEFITRADGFGFTVKTYNFRQAIAIERTLEEVDDVGVIRGLQADLAENGKMTIEYAIADMFNRGVNPSNAPVLADDGMYLIDTDRPNANPAAGTWSNQETASAITPTSLWTAQLNARQMTDENGRLYPQYIKKLVIRPDDEKTVQEILNSQLDPTNAMNTTNTMYKKFEYIVYDYLTDACIYYLMDDPKSEKNEARFYWRVRPGFETWKEQPDVTNQRVRFAFGLGLGCPRKMFRGGEVS